MAIQGSPRSLENRGTGTPVQGAPLPLAAPSRFFAAAQDLLDPPSVSLFVVASPRPSRELLEILASAHGVTLRGNAPSLNQAAQLPGSNPPEVLFIEEHIAVSAGEDLARCLGAWKGTGVVLIVDSPSDALLAYQLRAIDCLVTPIDREAVIRTVGHILEHVRLRRAGVLGEKFLELFHTVPDSPHFSGRIPVRSAGRISFLRTEEIDWLEAQGDYVCLHSGTKKHLVRNKISTLEQQLGTTAFVRIHRSIIVSIDRIRELQPLMYGEYTVVLADGTRLTLSRSYRQRALDLLTQVRSA